MATRKRRAPISSDVVFGTDVHGITLMYGHGLRGDSVERDHYPVPFMQWTRVSHTPHDG